MTTKKLLEIIGLKEGLDFETGGAKSFENTVAQSLERAGKVRRQVAVENRGDGRRGRVDIVLETATETVPIEIDRINPRAKSIFKVRSINPHNAFVLTRSPFRVLKF